MPNKRSEEARQADGTLLAFVCPNEDCPDFNRFGAGNLSVCERMGKDKQIRRLYCHRCGHRFSERHGTLFQGTKLPKETIVRIVKCLVHGCSIEATADICEVSRGTVKSLLKKAGRRAEDFHRLALGKITQPLDVVELDELHGRSAPPQKKGGSIKLALLAPVGSRVASAAVRAARGFIRRWRAQHGS